MSIAALSYVWANSRMEGGTLLTLLALADYADDQGYSFPAISTLARKARLSERQTQRVLRELVEAGEIRILRNEGRAGSNLYQIVRQRAEVKPPGGDNMPPPMGDTHDTPGVTPTTPGGVTPTTPDPSCDPSLDPPTVFAKAEGAELFAEYAGDLPPPLNTPALLSLWEDFKAHRKAKRAPLTGAAIKINVRKLLDMGPARALAALTHSIGSGYTGIFEPKSNENKPNNFHGGPIDRNRGTHNAGRASRYSREAREGKSGQPGDHTGGA